MILIDVRQKTRARTMPLPPLIGSRGATSTTNVTFLPVYETWRAWLDVQPFEVREIGEFAPTKTPHAPENAARPSQLHRRRHGVFDSSDEDSDADQFHGAEIMSAECMDMLDTTLDAEYMPRQRYAMQLGSAASAMDTEDLYTGSAMVDNGASSDDDDDPTCRPVRVNRRTW